MSKRPGPNSNNGFILKRMNENYNEKEKKNPVGGLGNNPIYLLLSTWILVHTSTEPEALYE